jgi:hypothetical protein
MTADRTCDPSGRHRFSEIPRFLAGDRHMGHTIGARSYWDPECLGADVNALVTQRMIGLAKRQLGAIPQFLGSLFQGSR